MRLTHPPWLVDTRYEIRDRRPAPAPAAQAPANAERTSTRGRKKKSTDPPVHLQNCRPTHQPSELLFLVFFWGTCLGVSRQGEFKNTINIFLQKVHVENFFQNFDQNFDVSFSSTFFVLSHFRVSFSDGSSKALQKTFCKQNRVEKLLQKNRPKTQNHFFLDFFYHVFGRFSVKGVEKHD
jgi:hypothetical protein